MDGLKDIDPDLRRPVLAVDLDGTLLRSDMLYESFWAAWAADWATPLVALKALAGGKAALKHELSERAPVDPALLPYNDDVIAYVRAWREKGGRTLLVTASAQSIADRVAEHLGIFDEALGSDQVRNLKGPNKAALLEARFGKQGFAYMGDHAADLPVWRVAGRAITVNASPPLRARAEAAAPEAEHITGGGPKVSTFLKALRPHQWLKNLLIFLPMITAHALGAATLLQSVLAFVAFSLVASSVYVLNDLLDLKPDRLHPRKRRRPFASGDLPLAHGTWMAALLLISGLGIAASVGLGFLGMVVVYQITTTAYSYWLKRRPIIDICTLAVLYTMRIVAGGVATGIPLSVWLLAFSLFLFLALAAVKRQAELADRVAAGEEKAEGRGYATSDLPLISQMAIASGYVSVLVMALYVNSEAVVQLYRFPAALWGICLVLLYWISRIVLVTHRGQMHDDPIVYAVKDRTSQVCGLLVFLFAVAGALL